MQPTASELIFHLPRPGVVCYPIRITGFVDRKCIALPRLSSISPSLPYFHGRRSSSLIFFTTYVDYFNFTAIPNRIRRCITITPQVRYRDLSAIVTNGRSIIEALVPPSRYIRSSTSHRSIGSILKENHLGGSSLSDPFTLSSCRTVLGLVVVHQQITCSGFIQPKKSPGRPSVGRPLDSDMFSFARFCQSFDFKYNALSSPTGAPQSM